MSNTQDLDKTLTELKLKKRELILARKNTDDIDGEIKRLEKSIKEKNE
ncbi:MAG: hypothetical protein ABRQ25_12570 [Clostridiaceae bacterium]